MFVSSKRYKNDIKDLTDKLKDKDQRIKDLSNVVKTKNQEIKELKDSNNDLAISCVNLQVELSDLKSKYNYLIEDSKSVKKAEKQLVKVTNNLKKTQSINFDKLVIDLGMTFKELAKALDISVSTLNTYRKDTSKIPPDRFKDIKSKIRKLKREQKLIKG